MDVTRTARYRSSQFTMADLRQIVTENSAVDDDVDVDIDKEAPYPGEWGSTYYTIEIG